MSNDEPIAERYMRLVDHLLSADQRLNPLGAGIVAASMLEVAHDSTAFCRALDISHALVLREIGSLAHELGLIEVRQRDARTQRCFYTLTEAARALLTL